MKYWGTFRQMFFWRHKRLTQVIGGKSHQPIIGFMTVTCGLTAKKPRSAPRSTLAIEYGTTLLIGPCRNQTCVTMRQLIGLTTEPRLLINKHSAQTLQLLRTNSRTGSTTQSKKSMMNCPWLVDKISGKVLIHDSINGLHPNVVGSK